METPARLLETYQQQFGEPPQLVVRAPGRVNLIGEHTDYNDGFVLPMAIDRATWIALRPRSDNQVVAHALDFGDSVSFDLDNMVKGEKHWSEYLKGVAWALQSAGHATPAWEGVITGDIPIGSGLSSSAALELATARAFIAVADAPWQPAEMALLGQKAENRWVGVNSGIMDQMISAVGEEGYALLIDCRSLDTESVPLPPDYAVIVMDTGTRRGLVNTAYNERREQCETAARHFGVPALRDVTLTEFESRKEELDEVTRRRARHIVTENARTLQAAEAMKAQNPITLGDLMSASHVSLRDDFEVSSPALDTMVELAHQQEGCVGARMTGAGFGGCAVALVKSDDVPTFIEQVSQQYQEQTGHEPALYLCRPSQGAAVIFRDEGVSHPHP